jgi:hypothetical protein
VDSPHVSLVKGGSQEENEPQVFRIDDIKGTD